MFAIEHTTVFLTNNKNYFSLSAAVLCIGWPNRGCLSIFTLCPERKSVYVDFVELVGPFSKSEPIDQDKSLRRADMNRTSNQ
jgi:hypothetical protein